MADAAGMSDSLPAADLMPLHPPDAVQESASVADHESVTEGSCPGTGSAGEALNESTGAEATLTAFVSVGAGEGETVGARDEMFADTDLETEPPEPEQRSVYMVGFRGTTVTTPVVGLDPLHPSDAVQVFTFVEDHERVED